MTCVKKKKKLHWGEKCFYSWTAQYVLYSALHKMHYVIYIIEFYVNLTVLNSQNTFFSQIWDYYSQLLYVFLCDYHGHDQSCSKMLEKVNNHQQAVLLRTRFLKQIINSIYNKCTRACVKVRFNMGVCNTSQTEVNLIFTSTTSSSGLLHQWDLHASSSENLHMLSKVEYRGLKVSFAHGGARMSPGCFDAGAWKADYCIAISMEVFSGVCLCPSHPHWPLPVKNKLFQCVFRIFLWEWLAQQYSYETAARFWSWSLKEWQRRKLQ